MDRDFPRSIHYCVTRADSSLRAITGTVPGNYHYTSERLMGLLRSELDFTPVDQILNSGLHGYLDALQIKVNEIDNAVLADFVEWRPAAKPAQTQTQTQTQGSKTFANGSR
jgi:uncharacterized alpha-E superfamily protein